MSPTAQEAAAPRRSLAPPRAAARRAAAHRCAGLACAVAWAASGAAAAEERPFSSGAAAAVYPGLLAGVGVEKGFFTTAVVRVEAFAVPTSAPGPRLGLSVWGAFPFGPKPTLDLRALGVSGEEQPSTAEVELWHYGVLATVRGEPERPISLDAAFGFGRVDLRGAPLAVTALPGLTGEVGLRHRLVGAAQVSWTLRASWLAAPPTSALNLAAVSAPAGQAGEDWWTVQLGPSISLTTF